jgi:hypothetical protein
LALGIDSLRPGHDRARFHCGVLSLDNYLQRQAGQDVRRNLARCYVLCEMAVIVDALDNGAARFYGHFGFRRLTDVPRRLFLEISAVHGTFS